MGHVYCDGVILSSPDKMNLLVVELWLQELLSSVDRGFTFCNFGVCLHSNHKPRFQEKSNCFPFKLLSPNVSILILKVS